MSFSLTSFRSTNRLRLRVTQWVGLILLGGASPLMSPGMLALPRTELPREPIPVAENQLSDVRGALMPETWARRPITGLMPTYPDEALRQGVSGLVFVRFQTSPDGEVIRIRARPQTHPLLVKAVIDALKNWTYPPRSAGDGTPFVPVYSRLTFNFVINNDESRVEFSTTNPDPHTYECWGCSHSDRETKEWKEWKDAWSKADYGQ